MKTTIPFVSRTPVPGTTTPEPKPPTAVCVQADHVPVAIYDAEVCGAVPLAGGRRGGGALRPRLRVVAPGVVQGVVGVGGPTAEARAHPPARRNPDRWSAISPARTLSTGCPSSGDGAEAGVADEAVAVGEGVPRRLGEQVQVLRGGVREAAQIEALQDAEDLERRDRAARHGGAEQIVPLVGDAHRIQNLRLVVGEVLSRQDAAVPPHLLVDGGRDLSPVEAVFALPADPFEGVGQVPLDDLGAARRGCTCPAGRRARPRRTGPGSACTWRSSGGWWGRPRTHPWRSGPPAPEAAPTGRTPNSSWARHMPAVIPGTPTERWPTALARSSTSYMPLPTHRLADDAEHGPKSRPGGHGVRSRTATVRRSEAMWDDHLAVAGDGGSSTARPRRGRSPSRRRRRRRSRRFRGCRRPPGRRPGARWRRAPFSTTTSSLSGRQTLRLLKGPAPPARRGRRCARARPSPRRRGCVPAPHR